MKLLQLAFVDFKGFEVLFSIPASAPVIEESNQRLTKATSDSGLFVISNWRQSGDSDVGGLLLNFFPPKVWPGAFHTTRALRGAVRRMEEGPRMWGLLPMLLIEEESQQLRSSG